MTQQPITRADCDMCDNTGFLDHQGFAMDECPYCTLSEVRQWVEDGCPEGVSGMLENVLKLLEAHRAAPSASSELVDAICDAIRFVDRACGEGLSFDDTPDPITIYERLTDFEGSEDEQWDTEKVVSYVREALASGASGGGS